MLKSISAFSFALAASLTAGMVHADTILGIYAGAGTWKGDWSGNIGDANSNIDVEGLGYGSEQNTMLWAALEHPIPFIPNIKLASTTMENSGTGTINETFSLGGVEFGTAEETVTSEADLSHIDATLYYEILDNWISLDLGITARMFDGEAFAEGTTSGRSEAEFSGTIPMGYAYAKFELPFTGWFVSGTLNALSFEDDSITDINASVGYFSDGLMVIDWGVNLGFRQFAIDADKLDDLYADVDISGPYAEFILHF